MKLCLLSSVRLSITMNQDEVQFCINTSMTGVCAYVCVCKNTFIIIHICSCTESWINRHLQYLPGLLMSIFVRTLCFEIINVDIFLNNNLSTLSKYAQKTKEKRIVQSTVFSLVWFWCVLLWSFIILQVIF